MIVLMPMLYAPQCSPFIPTVGEILSSGIPLYVAFRTALNLSSSVYTESRFDCFFANRSYLMKRDVGSRIARSNDTVRRQHERDQEVKEC